MPRLQRYSAPGWTQHVIQRGNDRSPMFRDEADYRFLRDCLIDACNLHGCRVHAYVFMTNHVHLLMTATVASGISLVMQDVGRRYVRRFNDRHGRTGTLWEGRFRSTVMDTVAYLFTCHRYVELNPVRAGLVTRPREYRWSSHRANGFGAADPLVSPHDLYVALGADARTRCAAYRMLFAERLPEPVLALVRDATNKGWALGDRGFRTMVEARLRRRAGPAPRGRRPQRNDAIRI